MKKLIVILLTLFFTVTASAETYLQIDFLLSGLRDPTTDNPLSYGKVKTFLDGTSTLANLKTDRNGSGSADNPFTLGADGTFEAYGNQVYKFEIYDSDNNLIDTLNGLQYKTVLLTEKSLNSEYGCDLSTALSSIGSVDPTTLNVDCECTLDSGEALAVTGNISTVIQNGGSIKGVFGGATESVDFATQPTIGWYEVFEDLSVTGLNLSHPIWFEGSDPGLQFNAAIAALEGTGTLQFTKSYIVETPINWTNMTDGSIFEGLGASFDGELKNLMLTFKNSAIGLDSTGSNNSIFRDFSYTSDSSTYPDVGILLARNAAGSGAGEHYFSNVKVNYNSKFGIAALYNYGSEVNNFDGCVFVNAEAGAATVYITAYNNIDPVSSVYVVPMATGSQSNSTFTFNGSSVYGLGGAAAKCFYLDGVQDFHWNDGFLFNSAGATPGHSYFYIDSTNSASDVFSIKGLRGEPGIGVEYGVFFSNDVARTYDGHSVKDSRITAQTNAFFASDNATMSGLIYEGIVDSTGKGVSLFDSSFCNINVGGSFFTARGVTTSGILKGNAKASFTLGALSKTIVHDYQNPNGGFIAYKSATSSNVTGDGTAYTIVANAEITDLGGNYDATTGIFTAPVSGFYTIYSSFYLTGLEAGDIIVTDLVTSNRTYEAQDLYTVSGETYGIIRRVDMEAGDTAFVTITVTGGDKDVNVFGNGTVLFTDFSAIFDNR